MCVCTFWGLWECSPYHSFTGDAATRSSRGVPCVGICADLWAEGRGLFFLSQRPYIPQASLRQQVLYPTPAEEAAQHSDQEIQVSDSVAPSLTKTVLSRPKGSLFAWAMAICDDVWGCG